MARQTVASFWRDIERAVQEGKEAAVREGAKLIHRATLEELDSGTPGRGRVYVKGGKGRRDAKGRFRKKGSVVTHRASRPGDAPAVDTGTLRRAVGMEIERGPNPRARVGVKRVAPYAKYLDPPEGEREPKIGRRPFLSAAVKKTRVQVQQVIRDQLEDALRRRT